MKQWFVGIEARFLKFTRPKFQVTCCKVHTWGHSILWHFIWQISILSVTKPECNLFFFVKDVAIHVNFVISRIPDVQNLLYAWTLISGFRKSWVTTILMQHIIMTFIFTAIQILFLLVELDCSLSNVSSPMGPSFAAPLLKHSSVRFSPSQWHSSFLWSGQSKLLSKRSPGAIYGSIGVSQFWLFCIFFTLNWPEIWWVFLTAQEWTTPMKSITALQ